MNIACFRPANASLSLKFSTNIYNVLLNRPPTHGRIRAELRGADTCKELYAWTHGPMFGDKPGEPVPQVDPEDFRAVWRYFKDSRLRSGQASQQVPTFFGRSANPVRTLRHSVTAMMLSVMIRHTQELLAPWNREGELDDAVFSAAAATPIGWIGVGTEHQGLPFDVEDFMRRIRG